MTAIDSINGMTHIEATKLRRARVRTTVTFLQIASSRSGRALLTKETGISSPKLLHWAKRAELMKIRDLGRDYSDLLEAVGVEIESQKKYTVGGWGSINPEVEGPPIYNLLENYVSNEKIIKPKYNNPVTVKGI